MNKNLLSLLTVLFCFLAFASVPVWGQSTIPRITSPAQYSTNLPQTFNLTVTRNTSTRRFKVEYINTCNNFYDSFLFPGTALAAGTAPVTIPMPTLTNNQAYLIVVTAYSNNAGTIPQGSDQITVGVGTTTIPVPQITSPTPGNTNTGTNLTVNVDPYPTFQACNLVDYLLIEYAKDGNFGYPDPNDPSTHMAPDYDWAIISGAGPYQWNFTGLSVASNYNIRATFFDDQGYSYVKEIDVFTGQAPTVTAPPQPYPTVNNVSVCGFYINVDPYPSADYVEIRWSGDPNAVSNPTGFNWTGVAASQVVTNSNTNGTFSTFIPQSGTLQPVTQYIVRVQAVKELSGEGTQNLGTTYRLVQTGAAPAYLPVVGPEESSTEGSLRFVSVPADNSTDVVQSPTFKIASYIGCASIFQNAQLELRRIGPGTTIPSPTPAFSTTDDPSDPTDYYKVSLGLNNSQPYVYEWPYELLQAGYIYQVRFSFLTTADPAPNSNNSTVITFITGNALGETYLTGTLSDSYTDPSSQEVYLNSYNQSVSVRPIIGANRYQIQLSKDGAFTQIQLDKTITATGSPVQFTFNPNEASLESGTKYYVRMKALQVDASNNIIGQGPWSSNGNVKSVYNSLHPLYIYRPTGTSARSTKLVASGVVANSDAAIFQLYRDNGDDVLTGADQVANFACYFRPCPTITDPVNGQVAYLGDWARNVFGGPQWTYEYVQDMEVGATYHLVVKAVRRGGANGYLQPGYYLPGAHSTFTVTNTARLGISWDQTVLFPNPFNEETKILLPDGIKTVKIRVTDLSGKVVEERSYTDLGGDSVPLGRTWRKGVYIVQLLADGQPLENMKVVKQ